jgi:hypothetical protein
MDIGNAIIITVKILNIKVKYIDSGIEKEEETQRVFGTAICVSSQCCINCSDFYLGMILIHGLSERSNCVLVTVGL